MQFLQIIQILFQDFFRIFLLIRQYIQVSSGLIPFPFAQLHLYPAIQIVINNFLYKKSPG